MIALNRENRKTKIQDGRSFRRYKRRSKVERFLAWLQSVRGIQTKWEHKLQPGATVAALRLAKM